MEQPDISQLRGLVATVALTGTVDSDYALFFSHMRSFNDRQGLHNIEYIIFNGVLVESARDEVVKHALAQGYDWILQIDADAAPFQDNALMQLLNRIYIEYPQIDAVSAYCQLKQEPHLPTIDTGTGKWEYHTPGKGLVPVIRTGAHFLLTKCSAFSSFGPPWFRTRLPITPLDAMMELDTFARTTLDGHNPLRDHPEWENLLHQAAEQGRANPATVGEDSSFCDTLVSLGGKVAVDTDLVVGHVGKKFILPKDLSKKRIESIKAQKQGLGVWPCDPV